MHQHFRHTITLAAALCAIGLVTHADAAHALCTSPPIAQFELKEAPATWACNTQQSFKVNYSVSAGKLTPAKVVVNMPIGMQYQSANGNLPTFANPSCTGSYLTGQVCTFNATTLDGSAGAIAGQFAINAYAYCESFTPGASTPVTFTGYLDGTFVGTASEACNLDDKPGSVGSNITRPALVQNIYSIPTLLAGFNSTFLSPNAGSCQVSPTGDYYRVAYLRFQVFRLTGEVPWEDPIVTFQMPTMTGAKWLGNQTGTQFSIAAPANLAMWDPMPTSISWRLENTQGQHYYLPDSNQYYYMYYAIPCNGGSPSTSGLTWAVNATEMGVQPQGDEDTGTWTSNSLTTPSCPNTKTNPYCPGYCENNNNPNLAISNQQSYSSAMLGSTFTHYSWMYNNGTAADDFFNFVLVQPTLKLTSVNSQVTHTGAACSFQRYKCNIPAKAGMDITRAEFLSDYINDECVVAAATFNVAANETFTHIVTYADSLECGGDAFQTIGASWGGTVPPGLVHWQHRTQLYTLTYLNYAALTCDNEGAALKLRSGGSRAYCPGNSDSTTTNETLVTISSAVPYYSYHNQPATAACGTTATLNFNTHNLNGYPASSVIIDPEWLVSVPDNATLLDCTWANQTGTSCSAPPILPMEEIIAPVTGARSLRFTTSDATTHWNLVTAPSYCSGAGCTPVGAGGLTCKLYFDCANEYVNQEAVQVCITSDARNNSLTTNQRICRTTSMSVPTQKKAVIAPICASDAYPPGRTFPAGTAGLRVQVSNSGGSNLTAVETEIPLPRVGDGTTTQINAYYIGAHTFGDETANCSIQCFTGTWGACPANPTAPNNITKTRLSCTTLKPYEEQTIDVFIGYNSEDGNPLGKVVIGTATMRDATLLPSTVQATTPTIVGRCPGDLDVCVFFDTDGDGTQDSGEPAMSGWPFTVIDKADTNNRFSSVVPASGRYTTTISSGDYNFSYQNPLDMDASTADVWQITRPVPTEFHIDPDETTEVCISARCSCNDNKACTSDTCSFLGTCTYTPIIPTNPPPDLCDGIDQDCDGLTDEDFVASASACGVGECANTGLTKCTAGVLGTTCVPKATATEICDNKDNDCDSSTDETLTRSTSCGVGVCSANTGTETCSAGTWGNNTCNPTAGAGTESCNNKDDNCNGSTDESVTRPTTCGVGRCAGNTGSESCAAGGWTNNTCNPTAGAIAETCNGIDDNCAGGTDDGLGSIPAANIKGACSANVQICSGVSGYTNAPGNYVPKAELCNGIDDNCDGQTDEGLGAIAADNVAGACAGNTKVCSGVSGYTSAPGNYVPKAETCNGVDDNCAGGVDEGMGAIPADNIAGACAANTKVCSGVGGYINAAGNYVPKAETCNGIDDNCAGGTDEGMTPIPADNIVGACSANTKVCSGVSGYTNAAGNYVPKAETCNGIDDNCAGGIDEGMGSIPADNIVGACSGNTKVCSGVSGYTNAAGNYVPKAETCNGIDDNCAGGTDEGMTAIPADNIVGACSGNTKVCSGVSGYTNAAGNYVPKAETCNGIDDNCAGGVDDGLGPIPADNIAGACSANVKTCLGASGYVASDTNYVPKAETCNGVDDNCSGTTDEGMGAIPADNVVGACSGNTKVCSGVGGYTNAAGNYVPKAETCNGVDDNCAGGVDEGMGTIPADNIAGACSANTKVCSGASGYTNAAGNYVPKAETCNGVDDNCSGTTDEGMGAIPADNVVGACSANTKVCSGVSGYTNAAGNYVPKAETCNGIDDNCAGGVDDGLGPIPADNIAGACSANVKTCLGASGYVASDTNYVPKAETCNGVDDNCSGTTDEGMGAIPADNVVGACSANTKVCSGASGYTNAAGNYVPKAETCNGVDDNCAGGTDEGMGAIPADNIVGACSANTKVCSGASGYTNAPGNYVPKAETCNGIDDNCAGGIDNGLGPIPADNVAGACAANTKVCSGASGYTNAAGNYVPKAETCNGIDDDCAAGVDDGLGPIPADNVAGACVANVKLCTGAGGYVHSDANYVPKAETCNGIDDDCAAGIDDGLEPIADGNTVGACATNVKVCEGVSGYVAAEDNYAPKAETCNGIDDDCAGGTDEGLGPIAATNVKGACAANVQLCAGVNGYLASNQNYVPKPETCNDTDDNCDGVVDEGLTRPTTCGIGVCAGTTGTETCAAGDWGGDTCNALGRATAESCNNLDDDCDSATDERCDDDGDDFCDGDIVCISGLVIDVCPRGCGDCDDNVTAGALANPGATEVCDNVDNDCNEGADEGCDDDGDGFCDAKMTCTPGVAVALCATGCDDCRDEDEAVHVGAIDVCNGIDDDCNAVTDDGFGVGSACTSGRGECEAQGMLVCNTAKDGTVCEATLGEPGPELCDDKDNDCDGVTDEQLGLGDACVVGRGACLSEPGVIVCREDLSPGCDAVAHEPTPELCDAIDNDCDGLTDNVVGSANTVCVALDTEFTRCPLAIINDTTITFEYRNTITATNLAFECSLDGGPWETCDDGAATYTNLTGGAHTLLVRAVGPDGGVDSSPDACGWTIDLSLPDTTIPVHPDALSQSATATFVFASPDATVSQFHCVVDPANVPAPVQSFVPCTTVKTLQGLSDGTHTVCAYATNAAGSTDPTPACFTWVIDTRFPETVIEAVGATTCSGTVTMAYAVPEESSITRFDCSVDGAAWFACNGGSFQVENLAAGQHTFDVRSIDGNGNADPTPARVTWVVDLVAPDTRIPIAPQDVAQSGDATFGFSSDEAGVSYVCVVDYAGVGAPPAESFVPCDVSLELEGLADGEHSLWVAAVDACRADTDPAQFTWLIDTRFPETAIDEHPPVQQSFGAESVFAFSDPTDPDMDYYECQLSTGTWVPCAGGAWEDDALPLGWHTLRVRTCTVTPTRQCDPTPAVYTWEIVDNACPLDLTAPTIVCAPDQVFECDNASADYDMGPLEATANDACSELDVTFEAPDVLPVGETTVVFQATDGNHNTATCITRFLVRDTEAPTLRCPDDIEAPTPRDSCGVHIDLPAPVAADACRGDNLIVYHNGPPVFGVGATIVTYTAIDAAGNSAECSLTVEVVDETPLELSCAEAISVDAGPDTCNWHGEVQATATDNCAVDAIIVDERNDYPVGVTQVVFQAADDAGNSDVCTTALTVRDVTPPVVDCGALTGAVPAVLTASATDACGGNAQITAVACTRVAEDGTRGVLPSAACPVSATGATLEITSRLEDGALEVAYTVSASDPSGNVTTRECTLTFTSDRDGDGVLDADDNCPATFNKDQRDGDVDTFGDACDVCPAVADGDQTDSDGDGFGDACDVCAAVADRDQDDGDDDGVGDACDVCPAVVDRDQDDGDDNGVGDACQDTDSDGVLDTDDNCPIDANNDQSDLDGDGMGDVCDPVDDGLVASGGGCSGGNGALFASMLFAGLALARAWLGRARAR